MTKPILALLALTLVLAACASVRNSRVNPLNWFGASSEEARLGPVSSEIDNRALVQSVTALSIEPTSSGALVRAEGMTASQGWWDAALVAENNGRPVDGVLTYRFVVAAPRSTSTGTLPGTQTVVVAAPVSAFQLEEISRIVVLGAQNSRSVRR